MKHIPYEAFQNYVLRSPLLSFDFYRELTAKEGISDTDVKKLLKDPVIREAIYLASPALYERINSWLCEEISSKKTEKLKLSILKYLSRMSTRCTPFGLFAGCAVGKFDDASEITLLGAAENKRHTRLDMNYLVALSQNLVKVRTIREMLLFFPNTSIYKVADQLRYVEYEYLKGSRKHHTIGVDYSIYLKRVLSAAENGKPINDLMHLLTDDEITQEEASEFIHDLIDSQLLISELEPSVSGPEFAEQIIDKLKGHTHTESIVQVLERIQTEMNVLDHSIGNHPRHYENISKELKELKTDFDPKFLFQTDMKLNPKKNTLRKGLIEDLKKGMVIMNKISFMPSMDRMSSFRQAFQERYEDREVSLATALDVETGIGYLQNSGASDINPLIDDLFIPGVQSKNQTVDFKWDALNQMFHEKLQKALKNDDYTVVLTDQELEPFEDQWDDLPDTIYCMVEIFNTKGREKISMKSAGGSSAANLIARFCHSDPEIEEHVKNIVAVEKRIGEDHIQAEIVHLPESRIGNVIMRPDFREFEIPYLARSIKPRDHQLTLDDLSISVRKNKVRLRSKRMNKEVIPYLSNAHNYPMNALPIYHFLSDHQTSGKRKSIGFHLAPFMENYEFLPRVEYRNLILHKATWNLRKVHIQEMLDVVDNDDQLRARIRDFRKGLQLPQYILLAERDNELIINLDNIDAIRLLLSEVSKKPAFQLIEFLFDESNIVEGEQGNHTNQFIVAFYNKEKLTHSR